MDAGTIEKTLPGLEPGTAEPTLKPGHAIPLTPQKVWKAVQAARTAGRR